MAPARPPRPGTRASVAVGQACKASSSGPARAWRSRARSSGAFVGRVRRAGAWRGRVRSHAGRRCAARPLRPAGLGRRRAGRAACGAHAPSTRPRRRARPHAGRRSPCSRPPAACPGTRPGGTWDARPCGPGRGSKARQAAPRRPGAARRAHAPATARSGPCRVPAPGRAWRRRAGQCRPKRAGPARPRAGAAAPRPGRPGPPGQAGPAPCRRGPRSRPGDARARGRHASPPARARAGQAPPGRGGSARTAPAPGRPPRASGTSTWAGHGARPGTGPAPSPPPSPAPRARPRPRGAGCRRKRDRRPGPDAPRPRAARSSAVPASSPRPGPVCGAFRPGPARAGPHRPHPAISGRHLRPPGARGRAGARHSRPSSSMGNRAGAIGTGRKRGRRCSLAPPAASLPLQHRRHLRHQRRTGPRRDARHAPVAQHRFQPRRRPGRLGRRWRRHPHRQQALRRRRRRQARILARPPVPAAQHARADALAPQRKPSGLRRLPPCAQPKCLVGPRAGPYAAAHGRRGLCPVRSDHHWPRPHA